MCKKRFGNIWKGIKKCVTLHRFRGKNGPRERNKKVLENIFRKISAKIWMFRKLALPLHHFPLRKRGGSKKESSENTE